MSEPKDVDALRAELDAYRADVERRFEELEKTDKTHDARFGHHSDRAKATDETAASAVTIARAAQVSVHDLEETWSDPDRAIIAAARRIESQNADQSRKLTRFDKTPAMTAWAGFVAMTLAALLHELWNQFAHH